LDSARYTNYDSLNMRANIKREGGGNDMGLTLACKDLDPKSNCPYVARGETMEQLMSDAGKHAKEVHSYTDEQLGSPEMKEKVKAAVKQE